MAGVEHRLPAHQRVALADPESVARPLLGVVEGDDPAGHTVEILAAEERHIGGSAGVVEPGPAVAAGRRPGRRGPRAARGAVEAPVADRDRLAAAARPRVHPVRGDELVFRREGRAAVGQDLALAGAGQAVHRAVGFRQQHPRPAARQVEGKAGRGDGAGRARHVRLDPPAPVRGQVAQAEVAPPARGEGHLPRHGAIGREEPQPHRRVLNRLAERPLQGGREDGGAVLGRADRQRQQQLGGIGSQRHFVRARGRAGRRGVRGAGRGDLRAARRGQRRQQADRQQHRDAEEGLAPDGAAQPARRRGDRPLVAIVAGRAGEPPQPGQDDGAVDRRQRDQRQDQRQLNQQGPPVGGRRQRGRGGDLRPGLVEAGQDERDDAGEREGREARRDRREDGIPVGRAERAEDRRQEQREGQQAADPEGRGGQVRPVHQQGERDRRGRRGVPAERGQGGQPRARAEDRPPAARRPGGGGQIRLLLAHVVLGGEQRQHQCRDQQQAEPREPERPEAGRQRPSEGGRAERRAGGCQRPGDRDRQQAGDLRDRQDQHRQPGPAQQPPLEEAAREDWGGGLRRVRVAPRSGRAEDEEAEGDRPNEQGEAEQVEPPPERLQDDRPVDARPGGVGGRRGRGAVEHVGRGDADAEAEAAGDGVGVGRKEGIADGVDAVRELLRQRDADGRRVTGDRRGVAHVDAPPPGIGHGHAVRPGLDRLGEGQPHLADVGRDDAAVGGGGALEEGVRRHVARRERGGNEQDQAGEQRQEDRSAAGHLRSPEFR